MYITTDDIKNTLRDARLTQIIDGDQDILNDAVNTAKAMLIDALAPRYDTDAIFALTGAARHAQVVWWMLSYTTFFLYQRVPDKQIPQRVIDNYAEAKETLLALESQERNSTLPIKLAQDGTPTPPKFRWGSETRRTI